MTALDRIHIILVHTAEPMNLGAAARAMKNCALSRLSLVVPRTLDLVTARRVAVGAEDLLAQPRVVGSLEEAVASAHWVVGTTSRSIRGRVPLTPREVAQEALRRPPGGEVALVFGGETSGLSNEALARCHAVSTIPTGTAQPSLNLAQAVLLYGYELLLSSREARAEVPGAPPRASAAEIAAVERALRALLAVSRFPDPDRPRHGVIDLMQPLRRGGLTPAEARLWVAALRGAAAALSRPGR